jgi:hypothetical protein
MKKGHMNLTNARLLAVTAFTLVALIARKPALGADASAPARPLIIANAAPVPPAPPPAPTVAADSTERGAPAQDADAPPPPPPPARRTRHHATLAIDEDGNATKTRNGVTTELTPEQFYRAVGRRDLADELHERRMHKVRMAVGGGVLMGLGVAALLGDLIYVASNYVDCAQPVGSHGCTGGTTTNSHVTSGVAIGGVAGLVLGGGVLIGSLVGIHPDEGGEDERRDLLDEYNARAMRSDAQKTGPTELNGANAHGVKPDAATPRQLALRSLASLRIAPVLNEQSRGVTLGVSF